MKQIKIKLDEFSKIYEKEDEKELRLSLKFLPLFSNEKAFHFDVIDEKKWFLISIKNGIEFETTKID